MTFQEIDIVHRLYKKSPTTKPIIVRFTSYKRNQNSSKLGLTLKTTKITEIIESVQHDVEARIYIDENLTERIQQLKGHENEESVKTPSSLDCSWKTFRLQN